MSDKLNKAREYEEKKEKMIVPEMRPLIHLTPRCGWMNDPNGFSLYKGEYHLFYQYYPYETVWGPMHWGHAVSKDLITWEYYPAAIAPDMEYDKNGCFSGSAIEMEDGRQLLVYTGVQKMEDEDGNIREVQTQCVAFGDGKDYEKYANNPVIDSTMLPEGAGKYDFRDPKVWRENGKYYIVVGNKTEDIDGQILQFVSDDGINWSYDKTVIKNNHRFGVMWECPDYFNHDGKQVLLTSPQDMLPEELEFHNGNGTLCVIGSIDENGEFCEENCQAVDYGIDFYAPQTIKTPDGRRVMIGWMQNWDTCNLHTESTPWFGQMSSPRELSLKDGILYQTPVRELEALRCDEVLYDEVVLDSEEIELDGISGRMLDLTVEIEPVDPEASFRRFAIRFAKDDDFYTEVRFRRKESTLKIDRMYSGSRRAIIHQRKALVSHDNGALKLRLILDRFSAEVFVNDGEKVMSTTLETDLSAERIAFLADGAVKLNVTKYTLAT